MITTTEISRRQQLAYSMIVYLFNVWIRKTYNAPKLPFFYEQLSYRSNIHTISNVAINTLDVIEYYYDPNNEVFAKKRYTKQNPDETLIPPGFCRI